MAAACIAPLTRASARTLTRVMAAAPLTVRRCRCTKEGGAGGEAGLGAVLRLPPACCARLLPIAALPGPSLRMNEC